MQAMEAAETAETRPKGVEREGGSREPAVDGSTWERQHSKVK